MKKWMKGKKVPNKASESLNIHTLQLVISSDSDLEGGK